QAVREDFCAGARRAHEGIAGRYVIVEPGIAGAVHVDAQDFAQQAVEVLAGVQRVAGAPAVADRDVEVAVGPKAEPATLVSVEGRLRDGEDRGGARRIGDVRGRRIDVIAANFRVAVGIADIDVKKAIAGEVRIEGQPDGPRSPSVLIWLVRLRNGFPRTCPEERSRILISPV